MSTEIPEDPARWYAIHALPKQENRAAQNLRAWNVETFNPLIKGRRSNQYSGKPFYVSQPLFPRYLFARFVASTLLSKVTFTRGVHSVVTFGNSPGFVDDEVIAALQARTRKDGFVMLEDELKAGDHVMIRHGAFKHFQGVLTREMNDAERVEILLAAVSYQGRVLIHRDSVEKLTE